MNTIPLLSLHQLYQVFPVVDMSVFRKSTKISSGSHTSLLTAQEIAQLFFAPRLSLIWKPFVDKLNNLTYTSPLNWYSRD